MKGFYSLIILLMLVATSCNTLKNSYVGPEEEAWSTLELPNQGQIDHTLFVFGEMGANPINSNPLTPHIKKALDNAAPNSSAIFLGSHLYPKGLSGKTKSKRPEQETELRSKMILLNDFRGNYYFISGEHDWEYRGDKGSVAVNRMEDFFEDELEAKDFFLPEKGCGDPYKLKIENNIVLLFINSQWWLEDWQNESKINKGCDIKSRTEFVDRFKELMLKNKNKQLVVVMHHPLYSDGVHGGNIPAKYHLFPITELKSKAWLPMPLLGSAAAAHRKISGYKQDLNHQRYRLLKEEITEILTLNRLKDIVFIAAHDQSLQYFHELENHFIVSGSAGGTGYARKGGKAGFATAKSGFTKLLYYSNNDVWMEFYGLDNDKLILLFRKQVKTGKADEEEVLASFNFKAIPDSIEAKAGPQYNVRKFRRFWFGNTFREEWNTPVTARALDINLEKGGLNPLRKGGGMQSNSLRLEDSLGRQMVFRSIYKYAKKSTPEFAQDTWAENLIQDMLSASHPYGAFVVPSLSKAAKVYYTEPELVYVPKQTGLGIYNESFGDELYLYEDRPAGNREDLDGFGNSEKIIGINDLLPKLHDKHDHVVDQKWVLKSRLFDLWLHDWDRHDDQWRWASFKEDGETTYRPIPRDRDQVFFTFDGPLPWLVGAIGIKKFRTFGHSLKAPQHQSYNARYFDRYFLTEMELEDWLEAAEDLQDRLTDSVITAAFDVWPSAIYDEGAEEIIEKLKSRREDLPNMAETLYRFLARSVNVVGTNEDDKFKVKRTRRGTTEVKVYELSKKGKKKERYYKRTFEKDETKEINLYGFGGDDEFELDGKGKKGITVRIIGGPGDDSVEDDSRVRGPKKLTKIYDEKDGIKYDDGKEIHNRTSDRYDINEYNREEFKFNIFFPKVNFGSNIDDGFFFGGGIGITLHGFRKEPYKAKHDINGLYAPRTNAFEFHYALHHVGTFHRLHSDLYFETDLYNPFYINYYGQGNESEFDQSLNDKYYWVRMTDYYLSSGIRKDWLNQRYSLKSGPQFRSSRVNVIEDRISEAPDLGLTDSDKMRKNYLGATFGATMTTVELVASKKTNGIVINALADYNNRIGMKEHYVKFSGDFNYYLTFFKKLPTTIATRVGAGAGFGDIPFYYSNHLGGDNYMRGYRNHRFSGSHFFYQNIDLRIQLANWRNKILPMEIGLLGGFDYGRVWEKGDDSNKLHKSYTTGIYVSPFTVMALTFNYTFAEEENLFSFGFGFFF
ncbi:MAG: BamA/TamA family outer membrane protein [Bacteroidetes bacterium]|nr:BamA/TamA family outer membrane protein [Bacteroidota bacterium]